VDKVDDVESPTMLSNRRCRVADDCPFGACFFFIIAECLIGSSHSVRNGGTGGA
jgi:hypothetical protein